MPGEEATLVVLGEAAGMPGEEAKTVGQMNGVATRIPYKATLRLGTASAVLGEATADARWEWRQLARWMRRLEGLGDTKTEEAG